METVVRKPLQGVTNIIRFNWHFYAIALLLAITLYVLILLAPSPLSTISLVALLVTMSLMASSLCVSCYVYDCSELYDLHWLRGEIKANDTVVNVNAGFDETSAIIRRQFPDVNLHVFDFYDPSKHTEVSIERARKAYTPYLLTTKISSGEIPLSTHSADCVMNFFSLHEVRNEQERINFLKEQRRVLRPGGRCIVVEHQRDIPNWIAYNIGFFHFHSKDTWRSNFNEAGFNDIRAHKLTPFVTIYILNKNGTAS